MGLGHLEGQIPLAGLFLQWRSRMLHFWGGDYPISAKLNSRSFLGLLYPQHGPQKELNNNLNLLLGGR